MSTKSTISTNEKYHLQKAPDLLKACMTLYCAIDFNQAMISPRRIDQITKLLRELEIDTENLEIEE